MTGAHVGVWMRSTRGSACVVGCGRYEVWGVGGTRQLDNIVEKDGCRIFPGSSSRWMPFSRWMPDTLSVLVAGCSPDTLSIFNSSKVARANAAPLNIIPCGCCCPVPFFGTSKTHCHDCRDYCLVRNRRGAAASFQEYAPSLNGVIPRLP